ncbi:MAG: MBL fold metallo-hydrolase [Pyrinomonadaceae bacterium]
MRILVLALLLLSTNIFAQTSQVRSGLPNGVTIEYVANEGILISSGTDKVFIDAIHRPYKDFAAFTPDEQLAKIESGRYPYNTATLVLVSHKHGDHFSAESVAMFLKKNKFASLASSKQVTDLVGPLVDEETKSRITSIDYEAGGAKDITFGDVKVRFLGMPHGGNPGFDPNTMHNFGHLIEIGGKKLLHLGDADMDAEMLGKFDLEKEKIDVVFAPYWFLDSAEGRKLFKKQLKAKTVVAIHVPPKDSSQVIRSLLNSMPSAVVFSAPGEMLNY